MGNKFEFVSNWFGGVTLGATPAFINNNLTGKQLMHCLKLSYGFEKYSLKKSYLKYRVANSLSMNFSFFLI